MKRRICAILFITFTPGTLFANSAVGIGWATIRGLGPGFQYATPQKQAAAELQYFHGAFSIISAQYRIAGGYEFSREAAYLRGGFGLGFLFSTFNAELAQALKTDSFGTVFVPSFTILIPCGDFGTKNSGFYCEPYLGGWFPFKAAEEDRFLFGLRILFGLP